MRPLIIFSLFLVLLHALPFKSYSEHRPNGIFFDEGFPRGVVGQCDIVAEGQYFLDDDYLPPVSVLLFAYDDEDNEFGTHCGNYQRLSDGWQSPEYPDEPCSLEVDKGGTYRVETVLLDWFDDVLFTEVYEIEVESCS